MQIKFKRDTFLSKLFPDIYLSEDEVLVSVIRVEYRPHEVDVELKEDEVIVTFKNHKPIKNPNYFFRATELCRAGRYLEAIPIFESLKETLPTDSEFFRNYAQAYEEIGEYEKAIDLLIEALKFDPKNNWALLLMGNIYSKHYGDNDTAYTFFEKVMENDPKNHIVLSNIGGIFLKAEKYKLSEMFFKKAINAAPDFPNALHGMALITNHEGNHLRAFELGCEALKNANNIEQRKVFIGFMTNVASSYIQKGLGHGKLVEYLESIQGLSKKEIQIEADNSIQTEAKLEIAENYQRDYHRILYRNNVVFVDHLVAHELTHLKYVEEARKEGVNMIFTSGFLEQKRFRELMDPSRKKLIAQGLDAERIDGFIDMVFHGTNSRIYNAPIDLFIEDHIYLTLPELRPLQYLSLKQLGKLALDAVTDRTILAMTPPSIVSKIKVYNVLSARQFDELYGESTELSYPVSKQEKLLVDQFWDEFNEYGKNREPGEEYELIQNWANDLELDKFFKLQVEERPEIENKPLTSEERKSLDDFLESQIAQDMNLEVLENMVDALTYFKGKDTSQIESVAFETAMKAKGGIGAKQEGIILDSIPGSTFTGIKLLSYYYVSWALWKPEFVGELGLPYQREFEAAKTFLAS